MAINLAQKYSKKVVERYSLKSRTDVGLNKDYDWAGVKTVTVYSVPTVALGDYERTGTSRYGTPTELQDTKQDLTLTKDRSVSITIDKGNDSEQMGIKEVGKVVARQTDEVFRPELDAYRIATWCATLNTTGTPVALSKDNIYTKFLTAQEYLDENKIPIDGRLCYLTPASYNFFKLDPNFVKASDMAQDMLKKGQLGEVDGTAMMKLPTTYFPANVGFLLIHPSCSCSPLKLEELKVHTNPPGINGKLIEMRYIYDCFVFDSKKDAICKHMNA
ncbi:N4-gp56 family major capsid protein [Anaerovorax sp. IOR16]|uniref:N4-gp56 family major capsid protein n=1 Tax=Anaerovorax sp. IOR16 TaxID=2773458 RepID=UPI0019CFF621|nr:N4-gp56 family major capsid protein [Anaerovorax sp. IOR16]